MSEHTVTLTVEEWMDIVYALGYAEVGTRYDYQESRAEAIQEAHEAVREQL